MTNSIFKTKEQYLTFRAVWASAVSDAKNQPRPKPQYKSHRYLNAAHHILYNVLRGRAFDRGFAPITNSNKLKNGTLINFGLYNGMYDLQNICESARQLDKGLTLSSYRTQRFAAFMKPFGTVVTVKMLASLDLPDTKPLDSMFGKSKKVANEIISGTFKPTNFKQVYDALASYK